jgi:hypothetical protein
VGCIGSGLYHGCLNAPKKKLHPAARKPLDKIGILVHNISTVFIPKIKLTRLMAVAYMAAAITGAFTFALTDSFPVLDIGKDELAPGGIFAPIDYAVGCLAEDSTAVGKAGRHSFSPVRNNLLRIDMATGLQNTETLFSHVSLRTIEETNHLNKKNVILLKLRI